MKKHIKLFVLALTIVSVFMASFATIASAKTAKKLRVVMVTAQEYQAGNYSPKNTIDGIDWTGGRDVQAEKNGLENRWSADGKGIWIKYQLGKIYTLTKLQIAWHFPNGQVTTFEAYTSTDNKKWTKVVSKRPSHKIVKPAEANFKNQEYKFKKPIKAKYVKLVCYGNDNPEFSQWNSIRETMIFGY